MPRLTSTTISNNVGHFGFSSIRPEEAAERASEYTLVSIAVDCSGSVSPFQQDLEEMLKNIISSCLLSPRAENLLVRVLTFSSAANEIHGFKFLGEINVDDYANTINASGSTALYDACVNSIEALNNFGNDLLNKELQVNGALYVITDGLDNQSKLSPGRIKQLLSQSITEEKLESLVSILIGVNVQDNYVESTLKGLSTDAGFTSYIQVKDATPKSLAKLGGFISKSISVQSNNIGNRTPSVPLTF